MAKPAPRPRLHALPETAEHGGVWACAAIRLLRPYGHASVARRAEVSSGPRLPRGGRIDAVLVQRGGPIGFTIGDAVELVRETRRRGARLIYDLDDDLLGEHPSPAVEAGTAPHRPRIRLFLREADLVVASTEVLAARLRRINPRVAVWPNALDEALVAERAAEVEEGADLGYFGTASHLEDMLSVLAPVEAALAARPGRPVVELRGVSDDPRLAALMAWRCEIRQVPPDGDYPAFMRSMQRGPRWRAGIAPLAANPFNEAKSDIKFLDYAAFGHPGVYARGPAYAAVRDGETGLLAGSAEEWGAAVGRLLEDVALRRRIRAASLDYLMRERVLARRAGELLDLVERLD